MAFSWLMVKGSGDPGIISKEESAQVDRILRSNSRLSSRTASAPYSLAGLVLCNQCQQKMNINRVTHSSQPMQGSTVGCIIVNSR